MPMQFWIENISENGRRDKEEHAEQQETLSVHMKVQQREPSYIKRKVDTVMMSLLMHIIRLCQQKSCWSSIYFVWIYQAVSVQCNI